MPTGRRVRTVDERIVHASVDCMFEVAQRVEAWPTHLAHYRDVQMRERRSDGGGLVAMAAQRPFGPLRWPVWWLAQMQVVRPPNSNPSIRFRHVDGVTRGMDVEWSFTPWPERFTPSTTPVATFVRIVHVWDGPAWPFVGPTVASGVIGPLFVHAIAARTLRGLAMVAEQRCSGDSPYIETESQ